MIDSDFYGLPDQTCHFVRRLHALGIDRVRIHGLFVLLGLYAGAPRPKDEIEILFRDLSQVVPIDLSRNINDIVEDFYEGYDREINELCFRSGLEFAFRQVKIPDVERSFAIVYLRDEGVLRSNVHSMRNLSDGFDLFDAFVLAIGACTAHKKRSLGDAFSCGIFQIQMHATIDTSGSAQISDLIKRYLPLFYSKCFDSLIENQIEYFIPLQAVQIPLLPLMTTLDGEFAQQMWAYQSRIFYNVGGELIKGITDLDMPRWHEWAVQCALDLFRAYGDNILPLSASGTPFSDVPDWTVISQEFLPCANYIMDIWGYSYDELYSPLQRYEYQAIILYVVYCSLTAMIER